MNIRTRLTLMGAGSILTTVGVLTAAGIWQGGVFHAKAQHEVDRLVGAEMARTTRSTYDLVRSQDQSLTAEVAHDQAVAGYMVQQGGGIDLSSTRISWVAINQFTHTRRTVALPQMRIGGRWLGQNRDFARPTPLTDSITELTGATATIFQRMDDHGDLLRVATTVRTLNGQRAVGTFIPAVNPDGTPDVVVAQILRGRVYRGNAFVVNAWYVSQYTPLRDRQGRVIGAFYTGLKQEQAPALRQTIEETRVGKTGTIRVLCGTGPQRGTYRIPTSDRPEGFDAWRARDGQGNHFIQEIIARALTLRPGQCVPVRYLAAATPTGPAAWHVAEVAYYRPWDWVIVADCRADDFKDFQDRLRAGQTAMALTFLALGLALAGVAGWFLRDAAVRIARAAGEVARAAEGLAGGTLAEFSRAIRALGAGDLDGDTLLLRAEPIPVRSHDEIGVMAASFNEMQDRITEASVGLDHARAGLRRAREELVAANASLEERVAERTLALRETEERTRLAVEAAHLGTWHIDLDTGHTSRSLSAWRMQGYVEAPQDQSFETWTSSLHPDDLSHVQAAMERVRAGRGGYDVEYRFVWPDGSVHWVASQGQLLRDPDGHARRILGVCRDITTEKEMEAERERLLSEAIARADHDPLTGLLNHRAFHKRLEEEAERAEHNAVPLAIVVMDLNNFKFFNDAYGHLAGDDVLRQVTRALESIHQPGHTVARFGGDEFAVLLPGANSEEITRFGAHLEAALGVGGYRPPGHEAAIPIEVSLGSAIFPGEAPTRLEALDLADARLRRAKTGGDGDGLVERLHTHFMHSVSGFSMLDALVTAVDNKDRYTRRHSEDVLAYSLEIARALGLDQRTQDTVAVAALLHDVGKVGVPDAVLRKPGRLTEEEFEAVRQHPQMGAAIVGAVAGFEGTLDAVRHHHERWDGGGYPFGLRGEETPLLARLMAVADAFSAMTTDRPYRKGMDPARAMAVLEEGAGTQWDPACVRALLGTDFPAAVETLTSLSDSSGTHLHQRAA